MFERIVFDVWTGVLLVSVCLGLLFQFVGGNKLVDWALSWVE